MDYSKESVTSCPAYCDRLIKLETIVDRFGDDCDKLTELHRKHLD